MLTPTDAIVDFGEVHVEQLVTAAVSGMEKASIPDITSTSDVVCAAFTILDRTLQAAARLQDPQDAADNAKEISRVLNELLVTYGRIPS